MRIKLGLTEDFNLCTKLFFILLAIPAIQINLGFNITASAIISILTCAVYMLSRKYYIDRYMLAVSLLFILGEALSMFACEDVSRSIHASGLKLIVILFLYPYINSKVKYDNERIKAFELFKVGCLITVFIVGLKTIFGIDVAGIVTFEFKAQRINFGGYGANVMARLFGIGSLFALYEAQIKTGMEKTKCYVEWLLLFYGILTTMSISGILIFAIGTIIIIVKCNKGVQKFGIFKFLTLVFIFFVIAIVVYSRTPAIKSLVDTIIMRSAGDPENITHGRFSGFGELFEHIYEYTLVGAGYGCSNYVMKKTIHVPLVAAFVETGIFGFCSIIVMYGAPVLRSLKRLQANGFEIVSFMAILIAVFDMIQPNPNYLFTWFAIFMGGITTAHVSSEDT